MNKTSYPKAVPAGGTGGTAFSYLLFFLLILNIASVRSVAACFLHLLFQLRLFMDDLTVRRRNRRPSGTHLRMRDARHRGRHACGVNVKTYDNDNGGRRSGIDRRTYSYAGCLPERRVTEDRRSGDDRRSGRDRRRPRQAGRDAGRDRRKRFRPIEDNATGADMEQSAPAED